MRRLHSVPPTLSLDEAAHRTWDIAVIGGGPAGAMAAREASRNGVKVLLIDRSSFPRQKVCGCCLNPAALNLLKRVGLGDLPAQLGGKALSEFQLSSGGRTANVPLAGGIAISREQFDAALVDAAIREGVAFLDSTEAGIRSALPGCRIDLKQQNASATATAKVVIGATGLGAKGFADDPANFRKCSSRSRIGAGAVFPASVAGYPSGILSMACGRDGYVGLVRLEDGRLDVAAALDPAATKRSGGIAPLVDRILEHAGLPTLPNVETTAWRGTAPLTQRRTRVFGDGYLLAGDAAGYVEPFTGEGIAWALAGGIAVVPFALQAMTESTERIGPLWSRAHRRLLKRRMVLCRSVSFLLRQPRLVNLGVNLLFRWPRLARPVERSLNAGFVF